MSDLPEAISTDPWSKLRTLTRARIGLERCGDGMSTATLLQLQLDHARARDAVQQSVDFASVAQALTPGPVIQVHSDAPDRTTYLRRPDLGRRLNAGSREALVQAPGAPGFDVVFVIADGLSSAAVEDHAAATLAACTQRLTGWRLAPTVMAAQARVALGDEVSQLLNADLCVVLIGERPGLSVANSLGVYLTWRPQTGQRDADRNCISNIHRDGLSHDQAGDKIAWLLTEARRRQMTGATLKEDAATVGLGSEGSAAKALTAQPHPHQP